MQSLAPRSYFSYYRNLSAMSILSLFLSRVLLWCMIPCINGLPHKHEADLNWILDELRFLSTFQNRLTGSPDHKRLIDRIENHLHDLGLGTHSDTYEFVYNESPTAEPQLLIGGESVPVAMYVPYSGNTGPEGTAAPLVEVASRPKIAPDWEQATGKIAVVSVACQRGDISKQIAVWPGSPKWGVRGCTPASVANSAVNMTGVAEAGVKGVIFAWGDITSANAFGQYGPFKTLYQDVPALYVAGEGAARVLQAARRNQPAIIVLQGNLVRERQTKTFWAIIPGTEYRNESVIYSTHTDGTNVVQENGYIALLAHAKALARSPPRRTTVLLFLTGHLHTAAITETGRVMDRWMKDHPELWRGDGDSGTMKTVFGSTVEHLGARQWFEDSDLRYYYPTGHPDDEILEAATPELASLLQVLWEGATPGMLRVSDPIRSLLEQPGEGLPFLWNDIPEVSLVSAPDWLLKQWPDEFDQMQLIDLSATKRQIRNFVRLWGIIDRFDASAFGTVDYSQKV
ncbi:hypothetical protein BJ170DRAFT_616713 [Xylariales sp. AK1849]|nr:hypothetical protein BJ170DRAFT_616713 [Xylariales sp. AK1849]